LELADSTRNPSSGHYDAIHRGGRRIAHEPSDEITAVTAAEVPKALPYFRGAR
jgi:hypothetical protein